MQINWHSYCECLGIIEEFVMSVSFRNIIAVSTLALLGGTAAIAQSNCCGTGGKFGGITNIPTVTTGSSGASGSGCCGVITGHQVGVPGVYAPSSNVNVSVTGANIGGSNYTVGGTTIGGSNIMMGGNTYIGGGSYYAGGSYGGGGSYYGGGGGTYLAPAPVSAGMIEGLNVAGAAGSAAAYETIMETKTTTEIIPIRAVCMDDKGMPHPASRLSADEKVEASFDGEVYRCMAGTHMEITLGKMVNGKAVFDKGTALSCQKGQALSYKNNNMVCVAQTKAKECNERSLLRRFGPGIKYVAITRTQQVASQRQIANASAQSQSMTIRSNFFVDGGVGQGVY